MYNDNYNNNRSSGALEIAMRARAREKQMALMTASFQAEQNNTGKKNSARGFLAQILGSLGIF